LVPLRQTVKWRQQHTRQCSDFSNTTVHSTVSVLHRRRQYIMQCHAISSNRHYTVQCRDRGSSAQYKNITVQYRTSVLHCTVLYGTVLHCTHRVARVERPETAAGMGPAKPHEAMFLKAHGREGGRNCGTVLPLSLHAWPRKKKRRKRFVPRG